MELIFALYARLWHEAATAENAELQKKLPAAFRQLAQWWDRFATTSIDSIKPVSGQEAFEAARRVATALAAWNKAGEAASNIAFWRPHAEEFDSPQAYGQVIEVLLDKRDLPAAMALLMHWLGDADNVRLDEGPRSFFALAMRWMQTAMEKTEGKQKAEGRRQKEETIAERSAAFFYSPFPIPHSPFCIADRQVLRLSGSQRRRVLGSSRLAAWRTGGERISLAARRAGGNCR